MLVSKKGMVIKMDNIVIQNRLARLREEMCENHIDYYMMTTADFHNSEYVNDYFKVREFFSGFTGSNGSLVVWQDGAGLWTDGRYFIQAGTELEGTSIQLFRMFDDGVPTIEEFLMKEMREEQTLGFDGRTISAMTGQKIEKDLKQKNIKIVYETDLAEKIWNERSAFPTGNITVLDEEIAGCSVAEKLTMVREELKNKEADSFLLTKLDDLMWLFNIRGCDVECNPVAMSYGYITDKDAILFIQDKALDDGVREYFRNNQIGIMEYHTIIDFLKRLPKAQSILIDERYCSYTLYKIIEPTQILKKSKNPTEILKAVKNPIELQNMERIYLKDSVALTKFIYWLKTGIKNGDKITEVSAADYLEGLRRQIPEFLDLSFPTIAGYQANAAMMHYEATLKSHSILQPEGMLLVDSGGQYMGGTTDVTRTIVLGPISDEVKMHYTVVAAGMLQMTYVKWIHGCTGRNLDIMARQPIWNLGLDYKCGTGHGIGYILNVHEGPQNFRWRFTEGMVEAVIEAGMVTSNEPGIYIEGSHGIRIENIMVAENGVKNEYGQFMHFDTLTYVPIDLEGVDVKYMTEEQRVLLNRYHQDVFVKIAPYLEEDEKKWLKEATRSL